MLKFMAKEIKLSKECLIQINFFSTARLQEGTLKKKSEKAMALFSLKIQDKVLEKSTKESFNFHPETFLATTSSEPRETKTDETDQQVFQTPRKLEKPGLINFLSLFVWGTLTP